MMSDSSLYFQSDTVYTLCFQSDTVYTLCFQSDRDTSIDVGIADGKPCAEWSGKRTKKKVLCTRPINDGTWHQLHITR